MKNLKKLCNRKMNKCSDRMEYIIHVIIDQLDSVNRRFLANSYNTNQKVSTQEKQILYIIRNLILIFLRVTNKLSQLQ